MRDPADTVVIDLDGTLTQDDRAVGYPDKAVAPHVVRAAAAARRRGFRLVVATSRNMRTFAGDVAKIEAHTRPIIETWLARHQIEVDALVVGKTWCGPQGVYVDDRNLHIEEFTARFAGPFAGVDLDVACWQPEAALQPDAHEVMQRLRRWFDVGAFFYPQLPAAPDAAAPLRDDPLAQQVPIPAGPSQPTAATRRAFLAACLARSSAGLLMWVEPPGPDFDPAALVALHAGRLARLRGPTAVTMTEVGGGSAGAGIARRALARLLGRGAIIGPTRALWAPRPALAAGLRAAVGDVHLGTALAGHLHRNALALPVPPAVAGEHGVARATRTYCRQAWLAARTGA